MTLWEIGCFGMYSHCFAFSDRLGDQIVSVNSTSLKAVPHHLAVQTLKDSGKYVNLVRLAVY